MSRNEKQVRMLRGENSGDDVDNNGARTGARSICTRCQRLERVCICKALPAATALELSQCHCLILQHPHELRRKNRSMPIVELCLAGESYTTVISRRFFSSPPIHSTSGVDDSPISQDAARARRILNDSKYVWLVYPHPEAISLDDALEELRQQVKGNGSAADDSTTTGQRKQRVTLVFIDATWKFANEIDRQNQDQYPPHMKRVQLTENDFESLPVAKRFDIRTPPTEQHLSTAECLAWTVSKVEQEPQIYETLMKPLDLVVEQWHSFRTQRLKEQGVE